MSDIKQAAIPQDLRQLENELGLTEGYLSKHYKLGTLGRTMQVLVKKQERIARLEAELAQEKEIGFATSAELEALRSERAALKRDAEFIINGLNAQVLAKDGEIERMEEESANRHERALSYAREVDSLKAQLAQAQASLASAEVRHEQVVAGLEKEIGLLRETTTRITDAPRPPKSR